jgi:mono/diheme cytochrome c family protein
MPVQDSALHRVIPFLCGIVFAVVLAFAGGYLYLRYGHPPVAVKDSAFPYEAQIVHVPLSARIDREMKNPPFAASDEVFQRGAQIYGQDCAFCHGTPGTDSPFGTSMYPSAPQLWRKHKTGSVVGVSDDDPGETYWKVKNGVRLTGMPTYSGLLSEEQMWDVTLLLKNADQQLPDDVLKRLKAQ